MTAATVHATVEGRAGILTLDRPRALNALDLPMILALRQALAAWRDDPALALVVIEGAGGRAFCSGGDVRAVRAMRIAGDHEGADAFFTEEYALNGEIARYPKPYVALIDGLCMGGGLGVSVHGSHRVVTEHALLAMPEMMIGLFPDIGASHFLPRLPDRIGIFGALTGYRFGAGDALLSGLATRHVPRDSLPALRAALAACRDRAAVEATLAAYALELPAPPLAKLRAAIARCFAADDAGAILAALAAEETPWARETLAMLRAGSPTSVCVSVELLRRGARQDLDACLATELALARSVTRSHDFLEGVRAQVVDKDRNPRWNPARIEEVRAEAVQALFAGGGGAP